MLAVFRMSLLLVAALIVTAEVMAASVIPKSESDNESQIFDFENYKRLFERNYSGLEETIRRKYFAARAMRVAIAAIKYQHGKMSHYLAINRFSDATAEELERMHNGVLEEELAARDLKRGGDETSRRQMPAFTTDDFNSNDDIDAKIRKPASNDPNKSASEDVSEFLEASDQKPKQRNKRDILGQKKQKDGKKKMKKGELLMSKLINTGRDFEIIQDIDVDWASSSPEIDPLHKPNKLARTSLEEMLSKVLLKGYAGDEQSWEDGVDPELGMLGQEDDESADLPDTRFSDLRLGGCFSVPRYQGTCGACYAFAFNFVMEWMHCKKSGKLEAFSEQYIIDCGSAYVAGIDGCRGGTIPSLAYFVNEFGVELDRNYPYMMREQYCPYSGDEPRNSTGYIRPDFGFDLYGIRPSRFAKHLEHVPILVNILIDPLTIAQYGGGVDAVSCKGGSKNSVHGVVLIGHGRENGKEYWLLRSSWSAGWGEHGYYKLAKSASCISKQVGYVYGSHDGINSAVNVDVNPIYDNKKIKDTIPKPLSKTTTDDLLMLHKMLFPQM